MTKRKGSNVQETKATKSGKSSQRYPQIVEELVEQITALDAEITAEVLASTLQQEAVEAMAEPVDPSYLTEEEKAEALAEFSRIDEAADTDLDAIRADMETMDTATYIHTLQTYFPDDYAALADADAVADASDEDEEDWESDEDDAMPEAAAPFTAGTFTLPIDTLKSICNDAVSINRKEGGISLLSMSAGTLTFSVSNGCEISLSRIIGTGSGEFEIGLHFATIGKIVKTMRGMVSFTVDKERGMTVCRIENNGLAVSIPESPAAPLPEHGIEKTIRFDRNSFCAAIAGLAGFSDTENTRYALTGILIDPRSYDDPDLKSGAGIVNFVATDGRQLKTVPLKHKGEALTEPVLIAAKSAAFFGKFTGNYIDCGVSKNGCYFEATDGDVTVSIHILEGRFPAWNKTVTNMQSELRTYIPLSAGELADFRAALESVRGIADRETKKVRITGIDGHVTVSVKNGLGVTAAKTVALPVQTDFSVNVDVERLLEVLDGFEEGTLSFHGSDPLCFADNTGKIGLLMPIAD